MISKEHLNGGLTMRFDPTDQIKIPLATLWNGCMTRTAV